MDTRSLVERLLSESRAQLGAADVLRRAGYPSSAIFHAVLGVKAAAAALRSSPGMASESVEDVFGPGDAQDTQDTQAPTPFLGVRPYDPPWLLGPTAAWLRGPAHAGTRAALASLERKLAGRTLYSASRFIDAWDYEGPPPSEIFTAEDAEAVLAAVAFAVETCRSRLAAAAETGAGAID